MDRVNVKMADLNLRASYNVKSGNQAKEASDDFKKLLQGQTDEGGTVAKDTKTEKKPEGSKESKDETEPVKDDKVQTEGLLAAYQMDLGMRPEMIQAESVVEEVMIPEVQMSEEVQIQTVGADLTAEEVMPEQVPTDAVIQTAEQKPAEKAPVTEDVTSQAVQPKEAAQETKPETVTVQKKSEETGEEAVQTDTRTAEQAVQPQTAEPVKAEVQEALPQETVRVQVPQPEALPEKMTDQIMAKMSDGVQEFEIQIEPENLGKIAVKILYNEGQTTVSILCSEKRTLDILGRSAGELGQVIEKNLGGTTTIIVDKQESDYLNQTRDENEQNGRESEQEQKQNKKDQNAEDAEQFLQKLRLGLAG